MGDVKVIDDYRLFPAALTLMIGESIYIACLLLLGLTFIVLLVGDKSKQGSGLSRIFWWIFCVSVGVSILAWFIGEYVIRPYNIVMLYFLLIWIPVAMLYWVVLNTVCRSTRLPLVEKVFFVAGLVMLPIAWHSMQYALISGALEPAGHSNIPLMAATFGLARITFVTSLCVVISMTWALYIRQATANANNVSDK